MECIYNTGDMCYLKDDGWKYVVGFSDRFEVDKNNPRIEVKIIEQ